MWWRRMRFTLGYMAREVALKGAISGALWVMYWFYADSMVGMSVEMFIGMAFIGLFGAVFGALVGLITGIVIGVIYMMANGAFLRDDMHLPLYRYSLMAIGGLLGFLSWSPFWLGAGRDYGVPLSGALLAAAGVVASTYTYLPVYIERIRYGRLYDPYDMGNGNAPVEYEPDPFI